MQYLLAENKRLNAEVCVLRRQQGKLANPPVVASHVTETMAQLLDVENEVSSEFPPGFGDNWAGRPRSRSSSSKTDQPRDHDPMPSSSQPDESNHQPTQFRDAHATSAMATDTHLLQTSNTEFQVSDTWDMTLPVESQAPLLTAPTIESFPASSSNVAPFISSQDQGFTLSETSLPTLDFSNQGWMEDNELPYDWPSTLCQHLDFPII